MTAAHEEGIWTLPGPRRFLDGLAASVAGPRGVVSLSLPNLWPDGVLAAAASLLRARLGLRVQVVDAGNGLGPRGPVHWLAARASAGATGLRTVPDFLDDPDLAGTVFLVHGAPRSDWRLWANFLRLATAERGRRERIAAPVVVFVPDSTVAPGETRAIFGSGGLRWIGCVGRLDTEMMVERALGARPDDGDLVNRTVASCIAEVAGWDPRTALFLARLPPDAALDPMALLAEQAERTPELPATWQDGFVDLWDGMPFEHSISLLKRGRRRDVVRRIWRAHVKAIFPFLDRVRLAVTRRHRAELLAGGPWFYDRDRYYEDPDDFELSEIQRRMKPLLPYVDWSFLYFCHKTRNKLAHLTPAKPEWILQISNYWEANQRRFLEDSHGWDWPRCGQRLVVMVGPPCPERTAWAAANFAPGDIVSPNPSAPPPLGADEGLWRLREEAMRRLSDGRSVVIDAAHDDAARHLACALSAARGIKVEFVDRHGRSEPFDGSSFPAAWNDRSLAAE